MKTALQKFGKFKQIEVEKQRLRANKGEPKLGAKTDSWPRKTTHVIPQTGSKKNYFRSGRKRQGIQHGIKRGGAEQVSS